MVLRVGVECGAKGPMNIVRGNPQGTGRKMASSSQSEIPDERQIFEIILPYVRDTPYHLPHMVRSHLELLMAWNTKIGLTSITDPRGILRTLFGESFFGIRAAGINGGLAVDVGSGAGFPGIPAAMMVPDLRVVLVESALKKAAFLGEVLRRLELGGRCEVFRGRFEQWDPQGTLADWVLSRALAIDRKFLSHAKRVLRPGGLVVLWTTTDIARRIASGFASGWQWKEAVPIPGAERRCLLAGVRSGG
jgi:16S rRNA (guanine527-N7)-methyltransferase